MVCLSLLNGTISKNKSGREGEDFSGPLLANAKPIDSANPNIIDWGIELVLDLVKKKGHQLGGPS